MIYPKTELQFISDEIGHGVVALEFIPAGTITWALDKLDREFTPTEFDKMDSVYQDILEFYSFRNNLGNLVLCWDNGRYVNHSFDSNCFTTAYDFEIAIRDIHPGEQLTDDYGYLNISAPFKGMDEGTKRKVVYPDDLVNYHSVWDDKLLEVFHKVTMVPQALKHLVKPEVWREVESVCNGEMRMKSILLNYYNQNQR